MTVAVDAEITASMQCLQRQRSHVLGAVEGLITETACHAGHLDAARELIDGQQWLVNT